MADPAKLPTDPLAFIQSCMRSRNVFWTYHVSMRMVSRNIRRDGLIAAVDQYEVIECYPEDKYLPSYLVLAQTGHDVFHILFACDVDGGNVRVVTAYRPNPSEWDQDLRRRVSP